MRKQGVKLRPPASSETLSRLSEMVNSRSSSGLIEMYQTFDGCSEGDFDANSFVTIWPLAKALDFSNANNLQGQIAFADWSFACDVAVCNTLELNEPVTWLGQCKPSSRTFEHFWKQLEDGLLDD